MCGVAGSGKTTFAQRLEQKGYVRLSIDEEIWITNGRYGIDFQAGKYEQYKADAEMKLRNRLISLIHDKQQVVIDFSFWQRAKRNGYKKLIEGSQRFDANAAFPITEDILATFLNGFEVPLDEGEIVIEH